MEEVRYQVFVSSTFLDLEEERQKVLQAILQRKAFPAGMELFPAADDDQFSFIKREIDSSDYYVIIIAGRYGTESADGLSYTEKEFDYAVSQGKPILAFLHKDPQQLAGHKLETSDAARSKLEQFRAKARRSRIVNHYLNSDDLRAQVLNSLVSEFDIRPKRGWVRAGSTPREDLERINALQERVLKLEEENTRLRRLDDTVEEQLASGRSPIVWQLDLNDLSIGTIWPLSRNIELDSTWDTLLQSIFSRGSSYVNENALRRSLLKEVVSSPHFKAPQQWLENWQSYLRNDSWTPNFKALELIVTDLHRQFTGLGLISESKETVYVPQLHGAAPVPQTMSIWKLTTKGERQIALSRGFKAS